MRSSGGPARSAFLCGTFVFLLAASGTRGESILLRAPPAIPVGNYPHYVEPGDFNGDGIPDLAVSERNERAVSIYMGNDPDCNSDTLFTKLGSFTTSSLPYNLTLFDLNQDGIVDLIAGLRLRGGVELLLGGGTGGVWDSTFSDPIFVYSGRGAYHAAVGDWNGDEVFDLAVVNDCFGTDEGDSVSILIGTGESGVWDGGFLDPVGYVVDHTPQMVIATDVDDDGILDLVTANAHGSSVSVLIGDGEAGVGDGTFLPRVDYPVGSGSHTLVCADFNEDGIEDLATCNWNHDNVSVLVGNGSGGVGDGTFSSFGNYPTGDAPRRIVTADLNGDGILDLATNEYYGRTVSVLLGRGSDGCGNGRFDPAMSFGGGGMSWSLAAGEFDGDGNVDLITANPHQDALMLLSGIGDGTVRTLEYEEIPKGAFSLVTGDFSGDQIPDLAVTCVEESVVAILLGIGPGGDGMPEPAGLFETGSGPTVIVADDFTSDGILDLAVGCGEDSTISVLIGGGSGGSGDGPFGVYTAYPLNGAPASIVTGDFNGDDIVDLAVSEADRDGIEVLLGRGSAGIGDGTFGSPSSFPTGAEPRGMATDDFDRDGIVDIAVASSGEDLVSLLFGNGSSGIGDGTFSPPVGYAVGERPRSLTVGDFDSDGIGDLAVSTAGSGEISILIGRGENGTGDGTFDNAVPYATGGAPVRVVSVDLNYDGILDLVAVDSLGGAAVVLTGNGSTGFGDGTFGESIPFGIESKTRDAASGDFDGDGRIDLVFTGPALLPEMEDRVEMVRNLSSGPSTPLPNGEPPGPAVILRNRPNPFNPATTIRFDLEREGPVIATVYDLPGRLVKHIADERRPPGPSELTWDGMNQHGKPARSGIYLIRIETPEWTRTVKAMLIR